MAEQLQHNDTREVLIVDDQPENLTVLRKMLSEHGYTVRAALNGQLALRTVEDAAPDLILLDIMMPEMDGFQVCRRLKENEDTRHIPVLFVSALSETVDKMRGFALGAVDYITKPFRAEEVLARVNAHMDLKKSRDALHESLRAKNDALVLQQAVFDTIQDTIVTVDKDLNIVSCNMELEGICPDPHGDTFTGKLEKGEGPFSRLLLETLRTGVPVRDHRTVYGGRELLLCCTPLVDSSNRFFGAALVIRDVSREAALEDRLGDRRSFMSLVGKSKVVQRLYTQVQQIGPTGVNVCVSGEQGVEKELAAEALHAFSPRGEQPFIRYDCAVEQNIEEKLVEANGGALFLDNVESLSQSGQAALLATLNTGKTSTHDADPPEDTTDLDVRVIISTTSDVDELTEKGILRQELAARLASLIVRIPPLRDRLEDLPLLCGHILRRFNVENGTHIKGASPEVLRLFQEREWPENVEELRKTLELAAAACNGDEITPEHLPGE